MARRGMAICSALATLLAGLCMVAAFPQSKNSLEGGPYLNWEPPSIPTPKIPSDKSPEEIINEQADAINSAAEVANEQSEQAQGKAKEKASQKANSDANPTRKYEEGYQRGFNKCLEGYEGSLLLQVKLGEEEKKDPFAPMTNKVAETQQKAQMAKTVADKKKAEAKKGADMKKEEAKSQGESSSNSDDVPESAEPFEDGFKSGFKDCRKEHSKAMLNIQTTPQPDLAALLSQVPPGYTLIPMSQLQALLPQMPISALTPAPIMNAQPQPSNILPSQLSMSSPVSQLGGALSNQHQLTASSPQGNPFYAAPPSMQMQMQQPQPVSNDRPLPKYKGLPGMALKMFDNVKGLIDQGKDAVHAVRDIMKAEASGVNPFMSLSPSTQQATQYAPSALYAPAYNQAPFAPMQFQQGWQPQATVNTPQMMNGGSNMQPTVMEVRQSLLQSGSAVAKDDNVVGLDSQQADEMMNG